MAKISTYPSADTPLLLSDRLIGTEAIREIPSPTPLATKNFSLGELLTLFSSNFPAPSLQEVLNTGNTATQSIYLTGTIEVDLIKPSNIEDTSGSQGTTFQYLSKGTSSISWVDLPVDGLQDVLNKQNTATQNITLVGNITSTYITPNNIKDELLNSGTVGQVLTKSATGIMWKNSSIPTAPSLADVLTTGNTATNDIILTGSFIKSGGTSSQFLKADGSVDSSTYALASSVPTATSDLINDGEDGINPFITAADIPPVTGFVPYTGATQNVDLGEYELKAGQLSLDITPTGTAVVGTTQWNNTIGSSQTLLKGGSVLLKNGVDLVARVVNKVTPNATLTKAAYQAVRVSGAQGQRLAVAYAQANNDNNSADTIGVVCETIATNQEGFILTVGQLEEINTTGSLQGETWADGDVLYLSPTIPGALTNIKPTGATGHIVVMGYVEYAHAIHGSIYVKIMNGWELDELHNVYINNPLNDQVLTYESATSLWKNKTPSTGLTVGTTPIASGTIGRVLFQGTGNVLQQSANLFWDNTNSRLGINTDAPEGVVHIVDQTLNDPLLFYKYSDNGLFAGGFFASKARGTVASPTAVQSGDRLLSILGRAYRTSGGNAFNGYSTGIFYIANENITSVANGSAITFETTANGTTSRSEKMRLFGSGNLSINTTTDAGFKLDVNGTARVSGILTLSTSGQITTGTNSLIFTSTGTPSRVMSWDAQNSNINLMAGGFGEGYFLGTRFALSRTATTFVSHDGLNAVGSAKITSYDANGNPSIQASNNGNRSIVLRGLGATGAVLIGNITTANGTSYSAILRADSTTQGFLPPRMTTTQKNAISSPDIGLVVYDTTLGKLCVRGASAWETITSI